MVVRFQKRCRKFRAKTTHGWGKKKRHRGRGTRGGGGRAGLHKHKFIYAMKHGLVKGSKASRELVGFKSKNTVPVRAVNVGELERIASTLKQTGKEKFIDLAALKFDKLLGAGTVTQPFVVKVASCSEHAKEKIEAAGGRVELHEAAEAAEAPKAGVAKAAGKPAKPEAAKKPEVVIEAKEKAKKTAEPEPGEDSDDSNGSEDDDSEDEEA